MKKTKIICLALLFEVLPHISEAGDIPVLSLNGNGMLTWTNSFTNALFTVQWAPSLAAGPTNTSWTDDWTALKNFSAPTGATSIAVPMFYRVRCQPATVRLGDAFFDDKSDQFPTNGYWPISGTGTNIYDGYGQWAGYTETRAFQPGGLVAGVKTQMFHQSGTSPEVTTGDYWWAMDILGNVRLLKTVLVSYPGFEASPTNPPPILLPASITLGQSWNKPGDWFTASGTNAISQGYSNLLQIQEVRSFQVIYRYLQPGVGQVVEDFFDNSSQSSYGWRLRAP